MVIPPMKFDYMTWEAAMTLLTGLLAVGAALVVGLRQAAIQHKQAKISEELTRVEALKLKSELFQRRLEVYRKASAWFGWFVTRGYVAGRPTRPARIVHSTDAERLTPGIGVSNEFLEAMLMSRFLFDPSVERALRAAWDASERWTAIAKEGPGSYISEPQRQEDLAEARKEILMIYDSLIDIFAPDLALTFP